MPNSIMMLALASFVALVYPLDSLAKKPRKAIVCEAALRLVMEDPKFEITTDEPYHLVATASGDSQVKENMNTWNALTKALMQANKKSDEEIVDKIADVSGFLASGLVGTGNAVQMIQKGFPIETAAYYGVGLAAILYGVLSSGIRYKRWVEADRSFGRVLRGVNRQLDRPSSNGASPVSHGLIVPLDWSRPTTEVVGSQIETPGVFIQRLDLLRRVFGVEQRYVGELHDTPLIFQFNFIPAENLNPSQIRFQFDVPHPRIPPSQNLESSGM